MKETVKPAPGDRGGVGELFATVTVRLATAVPVALSVTPLVGLVNDAPSSPPSGDVGPAALAPSVHVSSE